MKVGLIRHFKVTRGYPKKFVSGNGLLRWIKEYDASPVEETFINLQNIDWKRCFSSDLPRAKTTAEKAFNGKIVFLEELREVPLSPFFKSNIKLPLLIHLLFIRIAWLCNHKSQLESRSSVYKRINDTLDSLLESNEDVLIVGHGGIMMFMRKELLKRGYSGPKFRRAENGKLYVFENSKKKKEVK